MPDYCGRCGSPFEVDLDYGEARAGELFEGGATDLWKYGALYPLTSHQYGFELSLGSMRVEAISKARTTPAGCSVARPHPTAGERDRLIEILEPGVVALVS